MKQHFTTVFIAPIIYAVIESRTSKQISGNFHLAFNTLIATRIITPSDAIGRFSASCNHQIKASLSAHVSLLGLQVE